MAAGGRFFDPNGEGKPPDIVLRRIGPRRFELLESFAYQDPGYEQPFVIPAGRGTFDLTSVPGVFAWVVPGLGTHLPAVLLHDALVVGKGEAPTHVGPDVTREEADRIFRDAMSCLGTPRVRRWLIWAGASLGTTWTVMKPSGYWRTMMVVFFAGLALLGVLSTLDLLDVGWRLPWLGDRSVWYELPVAAALAVVVPVIAALLLWNGRWRVGAVSGVALAVLLPPTVLVVAALALYAALEWIASRTEGTGPRISGNLDD